MRYNYIYQITNLINKKIYVGVHKTSDLDDGYMGSGKVIKSAIKKYGLENFHKDIIEFFNTYDQALQREKEIVTDEFLLREDVYNLRRGGNGGFGKYHLTLAIESNAELKLRRIEKYYQNPKYCPQCNITIPYNKHSQKTFCSRSCAGLFNNKVRAESGWVRSEDSKLKTSKSLSGVSKTDEHKQKISEGRRRQIKDRLSKSELK
jgi:hypothetical protein